MSVELSFWGTLGTLSIITLFYVLAKLSERLGSVEKMTPVYRYYYVAQVFIIVGYLVQLLVVKINLAPADFPNWLISPWFVLLAHYLPLTIGITIGLVVTWRYWSWLVIEPTQ